MTGIEERVTEGIEVACHRIVSYGEVFQGFAVAGLLGADDTIFPGTTSFWGQVWFGSLES